MFVNSRPLSPPRTVLTISELDLSVFWFFRLRPWFSGGKVELSRDGKFLACLYEWDVSFVDVGEGVVTKRLRSEGNPGGDEEIVRYTLTLTHTHAYMTSMLIFVCPCFLAMSFVSR